MNLFSCENISQIITKSFLRSAFTLITSIIKLLIKKLVEDLQPCAH